MSKKIEITPNSKYGKLTILKEVQGKTYSYHKKGCTHIRRYVECKCDCGNIKIIPLSNITRGETNSCGCIQRERTSKAKKLLIPIGTKFGKLTYIEEAGQGSSKMRLIKCQCECGNIGTYRRGNLVNGHTQSCGCLHKESNSATHGLSKTPMWYLYRRIKSKCENPKDKDYPYIGNKGIKICERWEDIVNFINDMGEKPSPKYYLNRIDITKDFSPDNCLWSTNCPIYKPKPPKKPRKSQAINPEDRKIRLIWTKEKCQEEALKYNYRWEFGQTSRGAYTRALKNGWMDEICKHMEVLQTTRTIEECHQVALKYNKRIDFQKHDKAVNSYARYHGWLDEICKHMGSAKSLKKRIIYVYEFPDAIAYIGLTCDEEGRHQNHMTRVKSPVFKHIQKTNTLPIKKVLTNGYIDVQDAKKMEQNVMEQYMDNGWKLLNTYKGGQVGGTYMYTKSMCSEMAMKYNDIRDFKREQMGYYGAINRRGWNEELTGHMFKRRHWKNLKKDF